MKVLVHSLSIAVVLAAASLAGCTESKEETVTFLDNKVQVVKPAGWEVMTDVASANPEAEFGMKKGFDEAYMIVIAEDKGDLSSDVDLPTYFDVSKTTVMGGINSADDGGEPKSITVNGMKGMQSDITGEIDNTKIRYRHNVLEGKNHWYQVMLFAVPSAFDENEKDIDAIVQSVKEL